MPASATPLASMNQPLAHATGTLTRPEGRGRRGRMRASSRRSKQSFSTMPAAYRNTLAPAVKMNTRHSMTPPVTIQCAARMLESAVKIAGARTSSRIVRQDGGSGVAFGTMHRRQFRQMGECASSGFRGLVETGVELHREEAVIPCVAQGREIALEGHVAVAGHEVIVLHAADVLDVHVPDPACEQLDRVLRPFTVEPRMPDVEVDAEQLAADRVEHGAHFLRTFDEQTRLVFDA